MTSGLTTTAAMVLVVVGTLLSPLVSPVTADSPVTGIVTFTVLDHPPVILNVTTNAVGDNLSLIALVSELGSLVDVDRVIVYVYQAGNNASLSSYQQAERGFEWTRKGSGSSPANCSDSLGCWYEGSYTSWVQSGTILINASHSEIRSKTTTGTWSYTFNVVGWTAGDWTYEVRVYNRAGASAEFGGTFTVPN